jgi:hypothetical protein
VSTTRSETAPKAGGDKPPPLRIGSGGFVVASFMPAWDTYQPPNRSIWVSGSIHRSDEAGASRHGVPKPELGNQLQPASSEPALSNPAKLSASFHTLLLDDFGASLRESFYSAGIPLPRRSLRLPFRPEGARVSPIRPLGLPSRLWSLSHVC